MPFLVSFLLTATLTPLVILGARRLGWVARPREDRWHSKPTALMGGIAIFAGCIVSWIIYVPRNIQFPVALAAAAIFVLGLIDDRYTLRPHIKIIGQVTAAGIVIFGGVKLDSLPAVLAIPFTLFWIVGITNAINLLDNMDGLAAGISAIAALTMSLYCFGDGLGALASAGFAIAGSCTAFLLFNFHPAKIFMGDCGSMFLGFSLATLSLQGIHRSAPNLFLELLVPVAILAVPIFDTTLVSIARTLHGRSISQGGRDHSSHRLFALGLSERGTVVALYVLTSMFGGLALLSTRVPLLVVLPFAALLFTLLIVLGMYLGILKVYSDQSVLPANFRRLGGTVLFKKQMLQVLIDVQLACVAFAGANLLRFDGKLPSDISKTMVIVLPFVVVSKLVGLSICKAYRGVWRYAGMTDALTAFGGSTIGTVICALAILAFTQFEGVSRSALIIDWLLFSLLAIMGRTWYLVFRHLFGMIPARTGDRVLILGADPQAVVLAHRLRDPQSPRRAQVLGILDDDPGKHGRSLDGVKVLGPIESLPQLVISRGVTYCLLGVPEHSERAREIVGFCQANEIRVFDGMGSAVVSAESPGLAVVHS
jgi:UDP-GlcNAc:undecaprenyl-phosphate GlcNAc-1-phosphate transferase